MSLAVPIIGIGHVTLGLPEGAALTKIQNLEALSAIAAGICFYLLCIVAPIDMALDSTKQLKRVFRGKNEQESVWDKKPSVERALTTYVFLMIFFAVHALLIVSFASAYTDLGFMGENTEGVLEPAGFISMFEAYVNIVSVISYLIELGVILIIASAIFYAIPEEKLEPVEAWLNKVIKKNKKQAKKEELDAKN
jgi:hypothetical protein